ncbi:MAG: lactonase family protein [Treponema sp.]|jgi:6-phosphogluconolactonase|nr:lactonase family protein [Treponema sp.]
MKGCFAGFIGTYTQGAGGRAEGIYAFKLHPESGMITDLRLAAESVNPAYLALSPSKKHLYVTNETNACEGVVSAFALEGDGLRFLNQQSSKGTGPCHVAINNEATHMVVANYMSGTLCVLPLEPTGALGEPVQVIQFTGSGPNRERQEASHAHFFMFDPLNNYGFACDLGTDRVMVYSFDKDAAAPLSPAAVPWVSTKPGAGPRHGVFHPAGTYAYYVNELDSTVDVLRYAPSGGTASAGTFEKLQCISTLPPGVQVFNTAAAIRMSPDGNFVYTSNRGHDSITIFKVNNTTGTLDYILTVPSGGKTPRDFTIDPTGNFLLACHQDSDNLVIFRIDKPTGSLTPLREYAVPSPVCVLNVPPITT